MLISKISTLKTPPFKPEVLNLLGTMGPKKLKKFHVPQKCQ